MESSLFAIIESLLTARVDFILVGGVAAVLQGAPIHTYDVDVVFSQETANIERLSTALSFLDAILRVQAARKLKPAVSHLSGNGHLNLATKYGPLDLLTNIGDNLRYADLLPISQQIRIAADQSISVLNLEALIKLKEQLGRDKDLAVLAILRQTLNEARKQN